MDGRHFLGTARFLKNNCKEEASYRSAISRAYYASFLAIRQIAYEHCTKNVGQSYGIKNVDCIGHKPLQTYLKNSTDITLRNLGNDLSGLHGSRVDADYKLSHSCCESDAQDAIDEAEAILNLLASLPPKDIGKSVDDYIKMIQNVS